MTADIAHNERALGRKWEWAKAKTIKSSIENICTSDLVGNVLINGDSLLQGDIRYYTVSGDTNTVPASIITAFGSSSGLNLLDNSGNVLATLGTEQTINRKILKNSWKK